MIRIGGTLAGCCRTLGSRAGTEGNVVGSREICISFTVSPYLFSSLNLCYRVVPLCLKFRRSYCKSLKAPYIINLQVPRQGCSVFHPPTSVVASVVTLKRDPGVPNLRRRGQWRIQAYGYGSGVFCGTVRDEIAAQIIFSAEIQRFKSEHTNEIIIVIIIVFTFLYTVAKLSSRHNLNHKNVPI